ncbi:peptidoglycan D,D-transpeptidase FtsI family protein [Candidatus Liberibacter americanus]|uniref:Cell division protein FtsI/penicillin-binding protein 2 n=1 Tax=Candidatus Liberibacter americanus str. Sao Paulo TaxID=1261131 RepID=U6B4L1_9HYPH|nr:penicillin-binding protein 2 [Candidatus Liberibacter americanus]AHA27830.1 Cell division protein FtsI/penicillin-binding protein 2 [Candidatus Liberibacter americanus str. Sao Paulo]EMS35997.1 penicillin-binding transmembrane protein [Candidatus Liberibacter americanus PW_SP]
MVFPFVITSRFNTWFSMNLVNYLVNKRITFQGPNKEYFIHNNRKKIVIKINNRIFMVIVFFLGIYSILAIRLVQYGNIKHENVNRFSKLPSELYITSRPDIFDKNGYILATDIRTFSLYAEPHKVINIDEIVEKLQTVLPDIDVEKIRKKLTSNSKFQWLSRQLTPQQQKSILNLGLPGLGFRTEKTRLYPAASSALHVVGYVDIDNHGVTGIEKFIDMQGLSILSTSFMEEKSIKPIRLSIDLRVQDIVRQSLIENKKKYNAEAAGTVILNANTGEVVAMVSIPDHDPHEHKNSLKEGWLNRISYGIFEMGSIFKAFTIAMAIDSGLFTLEDKIDTSYPIKEGKFLIRDSHPQMRKLSLKEIFQYSSNIGAAKIADALGVEMHRDFLYKLGLLTKLETELPENKEPSYPYNWNRIHSLTIAFGHGIATTPLQTAVAAASLVNGGKLIPPTFMHRTREEADKLSSIVIKKSTVDAMRSLFYHGVVGGSGRRAFVPGFEVGGKTGTARKVVDGYYANDLNFNSFIAVFPISNPQYVVLSFIDSPKIKVYNKLTAGVNVAPMVGEIISKSANMLGVKPVLR